MASFATELNAVHPLAIVMPTLAAVAVTLCIPPFIWHLYNHNVGAAGLMVWLIVLNFMNFINALIWPNDNIFAYWNGEVFCDIEIRLMLGGTVALPGAVLCIVRDLAHALDTNRNVVSDSQKKRKLIVDLFLCFGLPLYFMGIYYIVQPGRYYIYAIQGCWYPIDESWVSIVLIVMWPLILTLIAAYFAGLILIRIHRYRREFSRLLASSSTTRSRFLRLFILSLIVLLIDLPLEIYWVYALIPKLHAYSWTFTHSDWNYTVKVPTHGQILLWNHWIWIAVAYVVFAFFGLVKDARDMYRGWLEKVGIGKILPSLVDRRSHAQNGRRSSWTGKAKLLWANAGFKASTNPSPTRSSFLSSKVASSNSLRAGSSRFTRCSDVLPTAATACHSQNGIADRTKPRFSFRQFLSYRWGSSQAQSTVAAAAEGDVEAGLPTSDKEVA